MKEEKIGLSTEVAIQYYKKSQRLRNNEQDVGSFRKLKNELMNKCNVTEIEAINNACKTLKTIKGVGDKVANCVVLFGLQMLNAFPIDVWMKKAIAAHYDKDFDPKIFAPYAGIAQQYMFYFARSGKDLLIS